MRNWASIGGRIGTIRVGQWFRDLELLPPDLGSPAALLDLYADTVRRGYIWPSEVAFITFLTLAEPVERIHLFSQRSLPCGVPARHV